MIIEFHEVESWEPNVMLLRFLLLRAGKMHVSKCCFGLKKDLFLRIFTSSLFVVIACFGKRHTETTGCIDSLALAWDML